jgi:spore germination protein GerM
MIPRHLQIGIVVVLAAVVVAAFYARSMRGRVAETESSAADTRPVAPPVSGPTEQVTLYVAYDDAGVLRPESARIPLPSGRQQRAQELLRALLDIYQSKKSPHPLAAGADIPDVYLVDPGLAVIDTNAAFADSHRSGVLVEELTVASLVQTLAANVPGVNRVKILVNGKERPTLAGHADLTQFYDDSNISRMLDGLGTSTQ